MEFSIRRGVIRPGKKVLIIDDEAEFVASTATLLEARGGEIDSAPNGKEGLEKAKKIILRAERKAAKTRGNFLKGGEDEKTS